MTTYENRRGVRMPRRARRAQLLEAALEVFSAQGYHAAAMDDIADRAGVSKPVLYQHFPGKLELYLALVDQACDTIIEACRTGLESTHDNKRRVSDAMSAFFRYVSGTDQFRLVFESDLANDPAVKERLDRVNTECAGMIAEVIHEDTGLSGEQARLLAICLVGMAQTSARYWLAEGGTLSEDEAVALVSALAWRGIGGYPIPGAVDEQP